MSAMRETEHPTPGRVRAIALLAASTLFMEALDGTIVAIALPDMARYFHADVVDMNLGMIGYLVALAALLPLSSWTADRWGPRRVFATAIGAFALTSLACALSPTLASFVLARALQGASAAMMTPVGRVVVLRSTEKSAMLNTLALLTWPALVAPAIAPVLGGLIVERLSWHWIFLINLPIGGCGVVLALLLLPRDAGTRDARADWPGLAMWIVAATLLVGGIESAERFSPMVMATIVALGAGAAALAWVHFRTRTSPLLAVRLIGAHRSFAAALLEGSAFRAAIMTNPFLLPVYFQVGLGKPIGETGLLIMIGMGGNIGMKAFTSAILRRFGFRRVLAVNGMLLAIGFAAFIWTGRDTPFSVLAGLLLFSGLCRSMQFTTLNTVAFADIAQHEIAAANTLLATAMQFNGAIGIAIGALAVQIGARYYSAGSAAAFHFGFATIAVISLAASLRCLRFDRTLGSSLIA